MRAADIREERGATLVELLVAMVMMVTVAGVAFAGLNNVTRTSIATEERGHAQAEVRGALELIIRDLRAANPINVRTPVSAYDNAVDFDVYCSTPGADGCGADNLQRIEYQITGNQLVRTAAGITTMRLGPSGPAALAPELQRNAVVNTAAQPVFTYFDADGDQIETSGAGAATSFHFNSCARSVEVHLVVRGEPGNAQSTTELRTTVDLRNFHEVDGCT